MDKRVKSERILDHITDTFYIYIYTLHESHIHVIKSGQIPIISIFLKPLMCLI